MFRTDLLSIVRSLNAVYTARGICHASYVDCLLAWSACTVSLPETYRVLYQNKLEKLCISLAFIIRIYHDTQKVFETILNSENKYHNPPSTQLTIPTFHPPTIPHTNQQSSDIHHYHYHHHHHHHHQ